ncbi:hypothetical protein PHO31112_05409 [Pandoraea horticolens]|uniref:Uncharacterized protein n=1 Tax=Pandoraea horticolens TaxID=2508298 RepID=A0A5E4ZFP2_9BURK|nr:hypothetical protein PHO31112_05409 [Pandoraea horticolens]
MKSQLKLIMWPAAFRRWVGTLTEATLPGPERTSISPDLWITL